MTACGEVVQSLFAFNKEGQPMLFVLDYPMPQQNLTVIIFDKYKENFDVNVGQHYKNNMICVTGKIELENKKQVTKKSFYYLFYGSVFNSLVSCLIHYVFSYKSYYSVGMATISSNVVAVFISTFSVAAGIRNLSPNFTLNV